ncbi:ABC transporter permease [Spirosoma flavum]|uniref:ABC transporter permease n=1 Tax=Spirosoma flavum TaxID=2048557 RepID=A0ABW6ANT1_9BACT
MLRSYFKIAFRNLRSQRSYTLLNIIGLSVGMAGGLLIFMFLRHHLSTDRHHAKFDRIFRIDTDLHLADGSIEYNPEAPLPMAQALRTEYPQVEQAAFLMMLRELTVSIKQSDQANGSPSGPKQTQSMRFQEHKGVGLVESEWFDIMDYRWLQGNPKTALHEPNSVVLTTSWAERYFGNANPIGRVMTLDNKVDVTVTGLLAEPPTTTDTDLGLFISLATLKTIDSTYSMTDWYWLNSTNRVYVTLKSPDAAPSIERTFPALSKKHYGADASVFHFHLQPMREFHFDVARGGTTIRASLLWSLGAVGMLLIVAACINFINLATVQALRRSKEVGVRKTLGSSRSQLIGQFLLETTLIILAATGLALLFIILLLPLFNEWVQLDLSLRPDWLTMCFIGLLLSGIILLAGGYPAAVLSGVEPWEALRGTLSAGSDRGFTVRKVLVVTQFVVCQALIIASLVVANQIRYIQQADLGFRKDNVVIVTLPYGQKAKQDAFKQQLSHYADIQSVSLSHLTPASNLQFGGSFKFNGSTEWSKFPIRDRLADADYLSTYGIKLLAGRNITPGDTIRDYVINETLLHKLGFRNPQQVLGKMLQYYLSPIPLPIVGVVKDFHQKSLRDEIGPCFIANQASWYKQAGIRISGNDPAQTLQHIRQTWQQLFPNDVFEYQYVDQQLAKFYETETLIARLTNIFTSIAILICCLGLYGLVSHVVVQRTKEIGIRKVLGASVASIVTLLSKDFLKLVLIAIVIASPLAWWTMNQWLQDFAYKITIGWWMFGLAGLVAVSIALLTVSFQSIKAALANPVKSLRSE